MLGGGSAPSAAPPISEWACRLEDGASAITHGPLCRLGSGSLVLAHTEKALRHTGEPFCAYMQFVATAREQCSRHHSARTAGTRTMLAGECPLFSAWGRFEDGAPATHVR